MGPRTLLSLVELSNQAVALGQLGQIRWNSNTFSGTEVVQFLSSLVTGFLVPRSDVDFCAVGYKTGSDLEGNSRKVSDSRLREDREGSVPFYRFLHGA